MSLFDEKGSVWVVDDAVEFDSIEELEDAMPEGNLEDLMTVAVLSAEETMHSIGRAFDVPSDHPLYNVVANLTLLNMACTFMYEIGYVDDAQKTLMDYCTFDFMVEQGFKQRPAPPPESGQGMDIGTSLPMAFSIGAMKLEPEQYTIAARKPKGKRVKYTFKNLSKTGRNKLPAPFKEIETGFATFIKQWLKDHKTEVARLAIQVGLEAVPGMDMFRVACALLPAVSSVIRIKIMIRRQSLSLTSFCALLLGTGAASKALVSKFGLSGSTASAAADFALDRVVDATLGKSLKRGMRFVKFMADRPFLPKNDQFAGFKGMSLLVCAIVLFKNIWFDYTYVFKPQNKHVWTEALIGSGNSAIDQAISIFNKRYVVAQFFEKNKHTATKLVWDAFELPKAQLRVFQKSQKEQYIKRLKKIEEERVERERDYYEYDEINAIDDMLAESETIVKSITGAVDLFSVAFAKILEFDPKLEQFNTFLNQADALSKRSDAEKPSFFQAARAVSYDLATVDFDATDPGLLAQFFVDMKELHRLAFGRSSATAASLTVKQKAFVRAFYDNRTIAQENEIIELMLSAGFQGMPGGRTRSTGRPYGAGTLLGDASTSTVDEIVNRFMASRVSVLE